LLVRPCLGTARPSPFISRIRPLHAFLSSGARKDKLVLHAWKRGCQLIFDISAVRLYA